MIISNLVGYLSSHIQHALVEYALFYIRTYNFPAEAEMKVDVDFLAFLCFETGKFQSMFLSNLV